MIPSPALVIRLDAPGDEAALERLARLDSQRPLPGPVLLAEVDGRLRAALELEGDRVIADPFAQTADLLPLLRLRTEQMSGAHQQRPRGRLRGRLGQLRRVVDGVVPAGG